MYSLTVMLAHRPAAKMLLLSFQFFLLLAVVYELLESFLAPDQYPCNALQMLLTRASAHPCHNQDQQGDQLNSYSLGYVFGLPIMAAVIGRLAFVATRFDLHSNFHNTYVLRDQRPVVRCVH